MAEIKNPDFVGQDFFESNKENIMNQIISSDPLY